MFWDAILIGIVIFASCVSEAYSRNMVQEIDFSRYLSDILR